MNLEIRIDEFVREQLIKQLKKIKSYPVNQKKIIHDPIIGSNLFLPHEISIIDTSLIQRLRRIHQTSLAFFTFPSATHTRFEHSLGVTIWATKIAESIKEYNNELIKDNFLKELRIASLMHDCGHSVFSHISECLLAQNKEFDAFRKSNDLEEVKPHEIMSYLIVQSPSFQEFLSEIKQIYGKQNFNTDHLGDLIIGRPYDSYKKYKTQILNGAIDADKLDYILRDSYSTGLKLVLDVERILSQISVGKKDNGIYELVMDLSGISPVEQILFSKMLLFSNMYHHQKVRASDCMILSLLEIALDEEINFSGYALKDPVTFIRINDNDILTHHKKKDSYYNTYLDRILNRNLLQRAVYLSKDSIKGNRISYKDMLEDFSDYETLKNARKDIAKMIGSGVKYYDIWIDFPDPPSFKEASQFEIRTLSGYKPFNEIFPIDKWLTSYNLFRYRGHLFCPIEIRDKTYKSFKNYIFEKYKLELKPLAWEMCKWNPEK